MSVQIAKERPKCGAKTRTHEGTCQNPPVRGSKRCRMHGGTSLAGIAHPGFKGRKTTALPERMQEAAEAAAKDPQLASVREDVVVLEARIIDLLRRVDMGESGRLWAQLVEAQRQVRRFRGTKYHDELELAEQEVDRLILEGAQDFQAWEEVQVTMDRRRKLLDYERKRMMDLRAIIPADRALSAMKSLLFAVQEEVSELPLPKEEIRACLGRIAQRAKYIMNMPEQQHGD